MSDPDSNQLMFDGRVALQDLHMPLYRRPIYELLHQRLTGGLGVFTGVSDNMLGVVGSDGLDVEDHHIAKNRHLTKGRFETVWQPGLTKWLENFKPDAMIAGANPRTLSTNLGRRWAQRRRIPVLGWGLGTLMLAQGGEGLRRFGRRRF